MLTPHEALELSVRILLVIDALIEGQLTNDYAAFSVNPDGRGCNLVAESVPNDIHLALVNEGPRSDKLIAASVQWAEKIMEKIDNVFRSSDLP